uniref:Uncharacterized protein n=1 Tax=Brassica oleracea var. oleracea TaxID=109376 RepID=A0A0D3CMJ0_BRAOL
MILEKERKALEAELLIIENKDTKTEKYLLDTTEKDNRPSSERALPHRDHQPLVTREALNEALEEVRDTMIQYTQCADPTESAARRERMRKAEEKGQLEETAVRMVQANLSSNDAEGPSKETENSAERIPASLRLGPSVPVEIEKEAAPTKKRLGRPPGKRTIPLSPKLTKGSTSRKRKIQQTKPPMVRRKMITEEAKASRQKTRGRISNSHDAEGSTNTSDNQPLCNTGLGNPRTVRRLKEMKRDIFPDIIFLMETKNPDAFILKKTEQLQYEHSHLVSLVGHGAGGLCLLWK